MKTYPIAGLVAVLAVAGTLAPAPAQHSSATRTADAANISFTTFGASD